MIRIGVVGSRRRHDIAAYDACKVEIIQIMDENPDEEFILVSGGCSHGADSFVHQLSTELGFDEPIEYLPQHPPDSAYYAICLALKQRNTRIANGCDILIACIAPDRMGGTEDTITKARRFKKEIRLV